MNAIGSPQAGRNSQLTKEARQTSAPYSDFINNRSMSASADDAARYEESALAKKGVETWLQNDVASGFPAPEQIAAGQNSDGTESPRRNESLGSPYLTQETQGHDTAHNEGRGEVDMYEQKILEEAAKKMQEATQKETRFSMRDILVNPALEDAAKQELRERPPITPCLSHVDSVVSITESRISHMEQTVCHSENLDRDADRDLQAGRTEIMTLVDRMNIGKTSCVNLLRFVQKLYQAEVSYSKTLLAVSRQPMANIGHTDGFRYASECLCELPVFVRSAHSKISQTLAECESQMNSVISKIKELTDSLIAETPKLTESVRSRRSALSTSKSRHQVAFKHMESIEESGSVPCSVENDPWLTEGRVAHDYTELINGQVCVKKTLASAYERCTEVEMLRLETAKAVISALVQSYGSAIDDCVMPFVTDINKALLVVDAEEEVLDLKKSKRNSMISEQSLRLQQAEQETSKYGELFASPDIIRQGALQLLDEPSRSWINARFVLTKGGLYWFFGENSSPCPNDSLSLAKTSIEQAKAPSLKLVDEGSGYFSWKRAIIVKAASTEEYCEWAIALREAIQKAKGRSK